MSVKDFYNDILGSAGLSFPVLWRVIRSAKLSRSIPLVFNFVVPGRIINALYRQIHKNKFIPKSMVIEPSYRCNMSCADCYAPEETTLMSGELLDSIITQAKKLGVFRFDLMGGEPTLPEVIDMALPVINKNKNCVFNICTNCTLIDQAFIDKVKGSKNIFFLLSMEGNKETTEARRGKGSYDAYLRSVQLLRQNKMAFSLSMTLDPNSWKEQISEQVIGDYVEAGGAIIYSYPRFNNQNKKFYELPRIEFLKQIQMLCKKYAVYWGDGHYGKMKAYKGIIPRHNNQVCINPSGKVRPYRFFAMPEFGDVSTTPLAEILASKELIDFKRESRTKANELLKDEKEELARQGFKVYNYKWRM